MQKRKSDDKKKKKKKTKKKPKEDGTNADGGANDHTQAGSERMIIRRRI